MSDFDEMMARKKEERSNARSRKRNVDIINDSDDLIVDMLKRMKEAAEVSLGGIIVNKSSFAPIILLSDLKLSFNRGLSFLIYDSFLSEYTVQCQ